jgi:HEAT repeat protein
MLFAKKRPNVEKLKASGDIRGLAKALSYKDKDDFSDFSVRYDAVKALVEIGCTDTGVVKLMVKTLQDEHDFVRSAVPIELGKLAPKIEDTSLLKYIVDSLVLALRDKASCGPAAWALGEICKREDVDLRTRILLVKPLINALKLASTIDGTPYDPREYVATGLWHVGEPAVTALIAALEDENEEVRWAAAGALGNIGDTRAVEPLRDCKSHRGEDKKLSKAIDEALEKLG